MVRHAKVSGCRERVPVFVWGIGRRVIGSDAEGMRERVEESGDAGVFVPFGGIVRVDPVASFDGAHRGIDEAFVDVLLDSRDGELGGAFGDVVFESAVRLPVPASFSDASVVSFVAFALVPCAEGSGRSEAVVPVAVEVVDITRVVHPEAAVEAVVVAVEASGATTATVAIAVKVRAHQSAVVGIYPVRVGGVADAEERRRDEEHQHDAPEHHHLFLAEELTRSARGEAPFRTTRHGYSLVKTRLLRALGVFDPSDRPRCVGVAWSFGAIERGRAFTAVASTRRVAWRPWCVHRSRPPRFGECASVGPKSLI